MIKTQAVTQYKFIEIVERSAGSNAWRITSKSNKMAILGEIGWFGPWKQYVAIFSHTAIFSHDCLEDIASFIQSRNNAAKE